MSTDGPADSPVKDQAGYRKLMTACENGDLEIIHGLFTKVYDPTKISVGIADHRPPHYWACRRGKLEALKVLIEKYKCNPHYVTENGHTLFHVAATRGHLEVAKYLVNKHLLDPNQANNEGVTPLFAACNNGHLEMVCYLTGDLKCDPKVSGALGESLLHISCNKGYLKLVQYLITQHRLDPNATSSLGETPLHSASRSGHLDVVKYLIEEQRCSASSVDYHGNTPLYVACQNGRINIVEYLIFEQKCDVGTRNFDGCTLLHTASRFGQKDVVKILLDTGGIDLESKTVEGKTPIEFAREKEIIKDLIRGGARTKGIPEILRQYKDQQPLDSLVHLYILGHPSSGKTTLVTALKKERIQSRVIAKIMQSRVTNVSPQTAGIIPVEFETADFGKVLLFDFAGQYEYYASHAALLEHTSTSSAPLFLLVVKLTESDADVKRRITYWLQFLESHHVPGTTAPHVIIIGSHKDILKRQQPESYKTKVSAIESFVKGKVMSDTSLHFAGFFAVDCRQPPKHRKLRQGIKNSCKKLRTDTEVDACCHVLSVFLLDEFRFQLSCTIADVIKVGRESHYPIPIHAERLCELSEALSDRMSILFLKNKQNLKESWIILDIDKLLHKIHGRIFAPKYFKEHCMEASSTGILSWAQIQTQFSDLDPELVIAFLGRLEFCQVVSDPEVLQLINGPPHLRGISTPHSSSSEEDIMTDSSKHTSMDSSYMASPLESPSPWDAQRDHGDANATPPSFPLPPAVPVDIPRRGLHQDTQPYTPPHNPSYTSRQAYTPHTYTTNTSNPQQTYASPCAHSSTPPLYILPHETLHGYSPPQTHTPPQIQKFRLQCTPHVYSPPEMCTPQIQDSRLPYTAQRQPIPQAQPNFYTLHRDQHPPSFQYAPSFQQVSPLQHSQPLQQVPPLQHAQLLQQAALQRQQYLTMLQNCHISPPSHPPNSHIPSSQQPPVSPRPPCSRNRHTHPSATKKTQAEPLPSQSQPPGRSSSCPRSSLPNIVPPEKSEQSSGPSHSSQSPSDGMKPYIFFPGLISSEQPEDMIWTKDDGFSFYTGWCLLCRQQNQFFTPRSLQILLLRLAFGFAVSKLSAPLNGFRDLFSGERECTIWKNGLRWLDLNGIETLVEMIDDGRAIVMLMRGKEGSEMSCVSLRSAVIRQILSVIEQYCRNVSASEYVLDPQQLKSENVYPLIKDSLDSMLLYDVSLIARAFVAELPYVWNTHHKGMVKVESLLYFDPYFQVGKTLLSNLYSDGQDLSQDFLHQLSLCQPQRVREFERIFTSGRQSPIPPSNSSHAAQLPNPLMDVFNRFWERGKVTMGSFREYLDKYSLFCGRNILELLQFPSHSPSGSTLSSSTSSLNPMS